LGDRLITTANTDVVLDGRPVNARSVEILWHIHTPIPMTKLIYFTDVEESDMVSINAAVKNIEVRKTSLWERKHGKTPKVYRTTIYLETIEEDLDEIR
jgi:hypothetical protein